MKSLAILHSTALLLGALTAARAEIPVAAAERIGAFKGKVQRGEINGHRTGHLTEPGKHRLFEPGLKAARFPDGFDEPDETPAAMDRWKGYGSLEEYEIATDGSIHEVKDMLSREWSDLGWEPRVDEADHEVAFSAPVDSSALHNTVEATELESLKAKAFQEAARKFKAFKGRIEFENVEVGYVNGAISNVRLRFRRLFKGGIVRHDVSFAYLVLDASGKVRELRVRWPKFSKIPGGFPSRSLEETIEDATGRLAEIPEIANSKETLGPLKARLEGMAFAWAAVELDGKRILTPGVSFATQVEYEGGRTMRPFIDVPLGRKYLK